MKVTYILLFAFMGMSAWASNNKPMVSTNMPADLEEQLKEEIFFYSKHLGLGPEVSIRVNLSLNLPEGFRGTTTHQYVGEGKSQVLITLDRKQAKADLLMTLAHEMVHAWQKVKGHLVVIDAQTAEWKGERIRMLWMKYQDRPWEKEADRIANELRKAYLLTKRVYMLFLK